VDNIMTKTLAQTVATALAATFLAVGAAQGQAPAAPAGPQPGMPAPTPNDTLVSPDIAADRRVTFRLYAPEARAVAVTGEFLAWGGPSLDLIRGDDGIWTGVSAPLTPGAYRYAFVMDGVQVADPRNPATSASLSQAKSLLVVSDGDFAASRPDVAHGAIAKVLYASPILGGVERQMQIYTPPGYGRDGRTYPVLYLLHGGGDADDSWPTVGRAGFILDNLIAEKKAPLMIVVMPAGAVRPTGQPMTWDAGLDPFTTDLLDAIMPYVETNYRVSKAPGQTALAGLSMGGIQTLNIGLTHTERFNWIGVFSSGWFPADLKAFEDRYGAGLPAKTAGLKLFYYSNGDTDIALPQAVKAYEMFSRRGVRLETHVFPGGHEWSVWRASLHEFAQKLFR
jgi:enterochelin esterase-like enzyme